MKLSIVVPCYNEEERLKELEKSIEEFQGIWKDDFEIIFVDDGSTDKTLSILENKYFLADLKKNNKFKLNGLKKNSGKGGALKAGIKDSTGDYILTMDADVSTHPKELLEWERKKKNIYSQGQIVIASRAHEKSELVEKIHRKIIGIVFNFLVRKIAGINVKDSQCGFKLYPLPVAKLLFMNLNINGWAHDVEILCRAKQIGVEIVEMPVTWTVKNNSKVKVFRDSIKMLIQILKIKLLILKKPLSKNETE